VAALLTIAICLMVGYGCLCGLLAEIGEAPRWLRWPLPIWNKLAHDWRAPSPTPPRPDYAKIERLERELGVIEAEPERPMRRGPKVCLAKNCIGGTRELRTWSGVLIARIHECD